MPRGPSVRRRCRHARSRSSELDRPGALGQAHNLKIEFPDVPADNETTCFVANVRPLVTSNRLHVSNGSEGACVHVMRVCTTLNTGGRIFPLEVHTRRHEAEVPIWGVTVS